MTLTDLISSTVLLIAFIDPFVSLAVLLSIHRTEKIDIPKTATIAVIIAGALMLLFILVGTSLLSFFNISLGAFKIGGGLVILILGIQNVLGIELNKQHGYSAVAVVIGTPLITGPGVATALILMRQKFGLIIPLEAAAIALGATWLFLLLGKRIEKILGQQIMLVFSRVIGLFLTGFAAQLIVEGAKSFF
ncbi:MAG: MarC family protein [Nanoarchaeota archaeon]|nr:MAG: MarC family protein [Nanoarchaeota archaeon]